MKSRLIILLATFALMPIIALAGGGEGFVPLVGIPGLESTGDFNGYINALYALAISIAALIAVVKIVLAGAKYMMDDIVTHKSEAKEDIKNALIGLLIIIGAVVILTTINSDLTHLSINAEKVELDNSRPKIENPFLTYCGTDGNCEVKDCNQFSTNEESWLYMPYISEFADGLTNAALCAIYCDYMQGDITGEASEPKCVHPKNSESLTETLVDDVIAASPLCTDNSCAPVQCPFLRYERTCAGWCKNNSGEYLDLGFSSTGQCVTRVTEENCTSLGTSDDGTSLGYDCVQQTEKCEATGGVANSDPTGSIVKCHGLSVNEEFECGSYENCAVVTEKCLALPNYESVQSPGPGSIICRVTE